MGTGSSLPLVKAQIVTQVRAALATASATGGQVQTEYAWPGPKTEAESVFLGRHPDLAELRVDAEHEIPNIKAGRKQRQEIYTVPVTVWVFRGDLTVAAAQTVEARAFAIADPIEDVFADDPLIGLTAADLQWAKVGDIQSTLWPFESGWACELVVNVEVHARLT